MKHSSAIIYQVILAIFFIACGGEAKKRETPGLIFMMKRPYTAEKTNTLLIPGAADANLKVKIENLGESFQAGLALGEISSASDAIDISYENKTSYKMMVSIYADDGGLLGASPIFWTYDYVVPPVPIVGFSKVATFDQNALLLFATNRGPLTKEAWISGDLAGKFPKDGSYHEIPPDGRLPITVSSGDGNKQINIKYRNVFGIESDAVSLNIFLKTQKPKECDSLVAATLVKSPLIRLKLMGQDPKPLYFGVQGDTLEVISFKKFSLNEVHEVELSPGNGLKKVTVLIRDEAENFCLRKNFEITVDPNASDTSLTITGSPAYTESSEIELNTTVNDFPESRLEMLVTGALENRQQLWQPFKAKFKATLSEGEGEKFLKIMIRNIGSQEIKYSATTSIFMKPFVYIKEANQGKILIFSEFHRIKAIDVVGCAEGGIDLKPVASLPCTPMGSEIKVTYRFDDGSTVTRSL